jgi:cell pole-organizing protein PopZ
LLATIISSDAATSRRAYFGGVEIVMSVAAPSSNEDRDDEALRRAQRAHEPSMEEILASIRAIIADDREPAAAPKPQVVYSSDSPRSAMASDIDESLPAAPAPTVVWTRDPETAMTPPEPAPPSVEEGPLMSEESETAIAISFHSLAESMAEHGREAAERMAREMLRPMLKDWLDENLPTIVERLVRTEIQRVARGGR